MKTIVLNAFLGFIFYLLAGTIFYGYQPFMLASLLIFMALFGFFQNKNKTLKEVKINLIALACPLVVLMAITAIFNRTLDAVIPYAFFTPLVLFLVYQAIINKDKRILFFTSIIGVIILSLIIFKEYCEQFFERFYILDIF